MALKTTIITNNITIKNILQILPNWGFKSHFKHTFKKARFITLLILSFLSFQFSFAQSIGDFRSIASGNWTSTSSWQTWNGSGWVIATSYPGQFIGTGAVLIQFGHSINISSTITTENFGEFTIAGRLVLNGDNSSGGMDFIINSPKIYVTPSPNGGFIEFNNKINLRLPAIAIFVVSSGGLDVASGCSANQIIYIGNTAYAKCNGGGSQLPDFEDLMYFGGTLNANPTSNSPVCYGNPINLIGGYTGVAGKINPIVGSPDGVNYSWSIIFPDSSTFSSTNKDISLSALQTGNYTATLTCTTYFGVAEFKNSKTFTVTVNPLPTTPTITAGSATSFCTGGSVNLTANVGTSYLWSTGATTQSITASTSGNYTVRVTNASGCQSAASTATVVTVNPLPTTPTITAGSSTTFCTGGSVNLTASVGTSYLWSTGATTQIINVSTGGNYTVNVTNVSGCQSAASVATIVTVNPTNTWNGSVSTDWNNPSNWSCGVPTPNSDILIPSALTQYPTLSIDLTLRNVDIQNGALLNVLNNGLIITDNLTLNGKIDLQNESQLVQTSTSTLISDCTTGKIEIDQQGVADPYSYNYWGSPVNSTCAASSASNNISSFLSDSSFPDNIKSFLYGSSAYYADSKSTPLNNGTPNLKLSTYWMYKFSNKPAGDYNSWTPIGNSGVLLAGEGFTLKGSNTDFTQQNYTFVGKPNNGLIELTVNSGMQYLIGNPYPSAIDAREFIKDNILQYIGTDGTHDGRRSENIIDGNLYFWDHYGFSTHLLKSYQGGYSIFNLSGEVKFERGGIPSPPGSKTPRQIIPVAQGFFINGLTNSGKIQFNNNQRFYQKEEIGISEFIRTSDKNNSKNQSSEIDLIKRIYLKFNSPSGFQRQILVAFIPKTTEGIDIGYDAINNEKFSEDMSWVNADNKFVIQAVPTLENRVLPLEVKVSSKGISKISIDHIDNISEDITILLKDNLNGMIYNLKTAPFEINLSPGTYTNRFELVLRSQQTLAIDEENIVDNGINIHLNNTENTIFINKSNLFEIKEISIHNMLGQQFQSITKGFDEHVVKIPINVQSGVYIVNVITDKGSVSKKIIKF